MESSLQAPANITSHISTRLTPFLPLSTKFITDKETFHDSEFDFITFEFPLWTDSTQTTP